MRARLGFASLVGASLLLAALQAGCGGRATALASMGVRVLSTEAGWYRLRSDEGYSFELPGVPRAVRETYQLSGESVLATLYDLEAEASSRAFLARAFDGSSMRAEERERLRAEAEAQITGTGETVTSRRSVFERGIEVHEAVVEGVAGADRRAIVRTFVDGAFVFQLVAVVLRGVGDPSDARRFFTSVRLERGGTPGGAQGMSSADARTTRH